MQPAWLQTHPSNFLDDIFTESEKGINIISSGGHNVNIKVSESLPDPIKQQLSEIEKSTYCKFILAQYSIFTPSIKKYLQIGIFLQIYLTNISFIPQTSL